MHYPESLSQLSTPCLLVNQLVVASNIGRMNRRAELLGVTLRPHLKTAKSVELARLVNPDQDAPITVSTLAEAEYFANAGFTDIMYAVSITADKLPRVKALYQQGARVKVILDSLEQARSVSAAAAEMSLPLQVLIEIDTDGHRAGIEPDDPGLTDIAACLSEASHVQFKGVMTHAGESYECTSVEAIQRHAEQERAGCVKAADRIRAAGLACQLVSVGSTPTALCAEHLEGVNELRAGVYVFFDLFQAGLGVCATGDIGLSVLTTVISHNVAHNRLIVDAGGLALSKDRSTAGQSVDCGYGLVCDIQGHLIDGLKVSAANQEHGIIDLPQHLTLTDFPVGSRVRILPNHACMTAAAHSQYFVVDDNQKIIDRWQRCNGW